MSTPDTERSPIEPLTDAVASVSQHPEWYFRTGTFSAPEMISLLALEATQHGAEDFTARRVDDWWVVASTFDWMRGSDDPFFTLAADPVSGVNASRVEILMTAFCPRVITAGPEGVLTISGSGRPPPRGVTSLTAQDVEWARLIAFVPPEAQDVTTGSRRPLVLVTPENLSELVRDAVSELPVKATRFNIPGSPR